MEAIAPVERGRARNPGAAAAGKQATTVEACWLAGDSGMATGTAGGGLSSGGARFRRGGTDGIESFRKNSFLQEYLERNVALRFSHSHALSARDRAPYPNLTVLAMRRTKHAR